MTTKAPPDLSCCQGLSRRNILLAGAALAAVSALGPGPGIVDLQVPLRNRRPEAEHPRHLGRRHRHLEHQPQQPRHDGLQTPNIDRIAREGVSFTDYYGQQSCTAGRAAFIGGTVPVRTGMTKVGLPGAKEGWQTSDPTIAAVLKDKGYATGQFGKNHLGDRDEHLPTMHGFDEYFGSLYHLNA